MARTTHKFTPGFSLIEVTISLGIASFALIALLGLVPLALGTLRQSMDVSTETQIFQQLASEANTLDFSAVTNSSFASGFPRFYDESGARITSVQSASYKVALTLSTCSVPGAAAASPARRLGFQVIKLHNAGTPSSQNLWIVDNGR
jgi:uncharacterized protein (TIGR02598 family)